MLVEPGNQFTLTRAALITCAAPKNQILISNSKKTWRQRGDE